MGDGALYSHGAVPACAGLLPVAGHGSQRPRGVPPELVSATWMRIDLGNQRSLEEGPVGRSHTGAAVRRVLRQELRHVRRPDSGPASVQKDELWSLYSAASAGQNA